MSAVADPFAQMAEMLEIEDEDERLTLIELARQDPIRGAPLILYDRKTGNEVEAVEPGEWRNGFADRMTGLPPGCPVVPLGSDGESFYFLNTLGQVHVLKAAASGKGPIDALFQGRGNYLLWAWPRWRMPRSRGDVKTIAGYEADECRIDLFAACAFKGTFEVEDRVRGRGAWREIDGSLVYHAGDAVLIKGRWEAPGEIGRFIYPARPRLGRPSLKYQREGAGSPGDVLLEHLRTFNWERGELDARLALGWTITAKVGGALERRPVLFVTGEEGSGKSTLQTLLRCAMNGALLATSNTTQAGIYQRVRQDSVAILVDEMEAKDDTRVVDKILELARIAYSGDKMQRGGKDGEGKEFALMSSFMGSSIAKPPTDAQDDSRMAVLLLRPLAKASTDALFEAKAIEQAGRDLTRRLIDWWPRWDALLKIFRVALIEAGHDSRSADTFGPLAAGAHLALFDDLPSVDELAWWKEKLQADQLAETANKERTSRRLAVQLLQAMPDAMRGTGHRSIEEVLIGWKTDSDMDLRPAEKVNERLSRFGVKLSWAKGEEINWANAHLFVPQKHPALHATLEGTPWAGRLGATGPWIGVLRQLPREMWYDTTSRMGLVNMRGIMIKLAALLDDEAAP